MGVGLAGAGDDVHAESRAMRMIGAFPARKCMKSLAYATVACVRHRAFEQRAADAAAAVRRQDREPELGDVVLEGDVRRGDKREPIVVDAKDRVAVEVDSIDVGGNRAWRKRRAESQTPILHGQREKMCHQRGASVRIQALRSDGRHRDSRSPAAE